MEVDIILEGFLQSKEYMHKLRLTIIGDEDSNDQFKILENVPSVRKKIKKINLCQLQIKN